MKNRLLLPLALLFAQAMSAADLGLFTGQTDIGAVARPGTARHDPASGSYVVGGSGGNMWFGRDEFHFVWTKVSGDIALAADVEILGQGGNAHRKAILMFRSSLAADAVYADAALHGDGLTSLQYRAEAGGNTREIQANLGGPRRLRIERIGRTVYLYAGTPGEEPAPTGCAVRVDLPGEFYVGIGVCAHDAGAFEQAAFTRVSLGAPTGRARAVRSAVETVPVASGDRRCVLADAGEITSLRWEADGGALAFKRDGKDCRLRLAAGARPEPVSGGPAGPDSAKAVSPDGRWVAQVGTVAVPGEADCQEVIITLTPAAGGEARPLVRFMARRGAIPPPAWSPDGARLAYVRNDPPRP